MKRTSISKLAYLSVSRARFDARKIFAMLSVKRGNPLMNTLIRVLYVMGGNITPNWARVIKLFLAKLHSLAKHMGPEGVARYLKVASVVTQQVAAGYRISDTTSLGLRISRSKSGLPRIIPAYHRKLIIRGDKKVLKFWLTMFSLFRNINFLSELKLSTITKPSTGSFSLSSFKDDFGPFVDLFFKSDDLVFKYSERGLGQMYTSGPQTTRSEDVFNSHPLSVLKSLSAFLHPENKSLLDSLLVIILETNNVSLSSLLDTLTHSQSLKNVLAYGKRLLGKLSLKIEAAGKVRVFAMVDPWTQWALDPIHNKLFKVLGRIPMDGTFNQMEPLKRVPFGKGPIFSFDLSAATDRLPIQLQEALLASAFGEALAKAWSNLLVNRSYQVPQKGALKHLSLKSKITPYVKYAVGQPMGALSSWAMLALVHHFILQHCAWTVSAVPRGTLFTQYAVLGDDVIIWNKKVANQYLQVLDSLGVTVGLAKSIISEKGIGLEFAKKTIVEGVDVSPISFLEQSSAHKNLGILREFVKKYNMSFLSALRFLGYGYQVDQTKNNRVVRAIKLALTIPKTYTDLKYLFLQSINVHQLSWKEVIANPLALRRKILVEIVNKELLAIVKRTKEMHDDVMQLDCSLKVDSIGPWATEWNKIEFQTKSTYTQKYMAELRTLTAQGQLLLSLNQDIFDFYNSPFWELSSSALGGSPYDLHPAPHDFLSALKFIFSAREQMDLIQVSQLRDPIMGISESPSFLEERRTLRLWSHWQQKLARGLMTPGSDSIF